MNLKLNKLLEVNEKPLMNRQVESGSARCGNKVTDLVLAVRFSVVRGTHSQDDDHDEQSSAGGQDGYQGSTIGGLL